MANRLPLQRENVERTPWGEYTFDRLDTPLVVRGQPGSAYVEPSTRTVYVASCVDADDFRLGFQAAMMLAQRMLEQGEVDDE